MKPAIHRERFGKGSYLANFVAAKCDTRDLQFEAEHVALQAHLYAFEVNGEGRAGRRQREANQREYQEAHDAVLQIWDTTYDSAIAAEAKRLAAAESLFEQERYRVKLT